jgi:hypothetical protein
MNTRKFLGVLVVAAAFGTGCSDDDVAGINSDCSNLQGVFDASSFTVTSTEGAATTSNLLADNGAFTITFGTGSFSSSYQGSTGSPLLRSGTLPTATSQNLSFSGGALFPGGGGGNSYQCSFDDDVVTLTAPQTTYTFGNETTPRAARVNIQLRMRPQV